MAYKRDEQELEKARSEIKELAKLVGKKLRELGYTAKRLKTNYVPIGFGYTWMLPKGIEVKVKEWQESFRYRRGIQIWRPSVIFTNRKQAGRYWGAGTYQQKLTKMVKVLAEIEEELVEYERFVKEKERTVKEEKAHLKSEVGLQESGELTRMLPGLYDHAEFMPLPSGGYRVNIGIKGVCVGETKKLIACVREVIEQFKAARSK